MSDKIREHVLTTLKNYRSNLASIEILQFELSMPLRTTGDEVIESMNFAVGDSIGGVKGHISDKTAYIALHYHQKEAALNMEATSDLADLLWRLEQERDRLHLYVSFIAPELAEVIRLHYFEGKSRSEVCKLTGIALRTYDKRHKDAIAELCRMYAMAKSFRNNPGK